MTIPTFTPFKNPIIGKKSGIKFRVLNAGFGDGYSQVTPDGLNTKTIATQSVIWNSLTVSQRQSITNQFDTFNGTTFAYQMPGFTETLFWRVASYDVDDSDGFYEAISADFMRVFDLS
jgi:phage-related protein